MTSNLLDPEWHISNEGLDILTENRTIVDRRKVLKLALDSDLKQIGETFLANELTKNTTSKIVLQIQKIRNISAPKANENSQAAPRMLKLILTDGHTNVQAIEYQPINSISRDKTPPGTKLLINSAKIYSGFLLINPSTCSVLGGEVPHLYEKWILAKSVQQNRRTGTSGAPAWVNFGSKIRADNQEGNFKALVNKETNAENPEFEQQRKEAIAEAVTGAVKKTFGGRVKQNVQPVNNTNSNNRRGERPERGRKGKMGAKDEDDEMPLKPSDKVSLFSFLEDKLPAKEVKASSSGGYNQGKPQRNQDYSNNYNNYASKQYGDGQAFNNYGQQPHNNYQHSNNKEQGFSYNRNPQQNRGYNNPSNNQYKTQYPDSKVKTFPPRNENYNKGNNQHYNKNNQENNYNKQNFNPKYQNQPQKPPGPQQNHSYPNPAQKVYKSENEPIKPPQDSQNHVKNNVNSEFASRSFRQHLNLGPANKKIDERVNDSNLVANIGDNVKAKYWEDNQYYDATITAITEKTYVVKFKGYENIEEVLKSDCLPSETNAPNRSHNPAFSGSMEFRRTFRK